MSTEAREFAEAASMVMQIREEQDSVLTLVLLSLAYSAIELAEAFREIATNDAEAQR